MHCRRCYVSVAELNGLIYAIGGYDGHNRLNTVERYNPKTNQWSVITPMNMQRSDASACTLKGKIYATGMFAYVMSLRVDLLKGWFFSFLFFFVLLS